MDNLSLVTTGWVRLSSSRSDYRRGYFWEGAAGHPPTHRHEGGCQDPSEGKNSRTGRYREGHPLNLYFEDTSTPQHRTTLRGIHLSTQIIETKTDIHLIMEYAPGGELFDYIVRKKRLDEQEAISFMQQILSGV